jgi:hypothetical protein
LAYNHSIEIRFHDSFQKKRQWYTKTHASSLHEQMPPISLGWKAIQEQVVSSCALVLEAGKAKSDFVLWMS